MGHHQLISLTASKPGKEREFVDWYNDVHVPEVLLVPGIISAKTSRLGERMGYVPWQQLAVFEVETDDPDAVIPEIKARLEAGTMTLSDSIEMTAVSLFMV